MAKTKAPIAQTPAISTRAELEAHLAARAKPTTEHHLTPQGWEAVQVRRNANALAENRIKFLQQRLNALKQGCAKDHKKALLKRKAKEVFERGK